MVRVADEGARVSFAAKRKSTPALVITGVNVSGNDSDFTACGNVTTGDGAGVATPSASVSGGSGNYSYSWAQIGTPATAGPFICSNAAALNPTWHDTVCDGDALASETWRLTVTDNDTGITGTLDITVTLAWANLT